MSLLREVYQGSSPTSIDFHPDNSNFLLVGTDVGEVSLWDLASRNSITYFFGVWDVKSYDCRNCLSSRNEDRSISVSCIRWSSDGSYFGVAFSKHVVHLYHYHGGILITGHGEIFAHKGIVSDLYFTCIKNKHMVLTCGDDGCIKGWDLLSCRKLFSFEGDAEKPVHCIRPYIDEKNTHYTLSTSSDGNIRMWFHDTATSEIIHRTSETSLTSCFIDDGKTKRFFSCGKKEDNTLNLVEWNGNGKVCRTYKGLTKCDSDVFQLETALNRVLAVGNDYQVKMWTMHDSDLMLSYEEEGLPASPVIRFDKTGKLLAVSTIDNKIRVITTEKSETKEDTKQPKRKPREITRRRTQIGTGVQLI